MGDHDEEDPPRILSGRAGAPPALVRELESARTEPDAHQLEALGQMIAATIAASGAPATAASATSPAAATTGSSFGVGLKLFIASVVVVGAIGGYVAWNAVSVQDPARATRTPPISATAIEAPVDPAPPVRASPDPSVVVEPEGMPAVITEDPETEEPRRSRRVVDESTGLLQAAGALGRGQPSDAYEIAREHERMYSRSRLSEERSVILIEAAARLGRTAEARRRAERFYARYPSSVHRPRVDRAMQGR